MKPYLLFVFLVHALFYSTALSEPVSPLKMVKPDKVGMDAEKLKLVDQKMEELIKEERLTGGIVVVARKGKVVHFGTYGKRDLENNLPVEKDTIFRIYSMTKAITSVAALILNEEGKINLDDPLSKYFPSLKEMKVLN
jgi:CubicO group peptidase (beta-lactamase class C family)